MTKIRSTTSKTDALDKYFRSSGRTESRKQDRKQKAGQQSKAGQKAMTLAPEGRQRRGRPTKTWSRTVEKERERTGWRSWSEVSAAVADRAGWRQSVEAY